jgi:putative thioredoxin
MVLVRYRRTGRAAAPTGIVPRMSIDVTDETFESDVINRSMTMPVVVDLCAPWCGPCTTLGPILEKVVEATNGEVALVKVNTDENPGISNAFRVQSIPAVYALRNGEVVDGFVGAYPEHVVEQFVNGLLPSPEAVTVASLVDQGSEPALRSALDLDPGNEDAVCALADMLIERGDNDEALQFLARIPETDRTRVLAARARLVLTPDDDHDVTLLMLLDRVKADEDARQQYLDILELMGPLDPRTADYRKKLTTRLF